MKRIHPDDQPLLIDLDFLFFNKNVIDNNTMGSHLSPNKILKKHGIVREHILFYFMLKLFLSKYNTFKSPIKGFTKRTFVPSQFENWLIKHGYIARNERGLIKKFFNDKRYFSLRHSTEKIAFLKSKPEILSTQGKQFKNDTTEYFAVPRKIGRNKINNLITEELFERVIQQPSLLGETITVENVMTRSHNTIAKMLGVDASTVSKRLGSKPKSFAFLRVSKEEYDRAMYFKDEFKNQKSSSLYDIAFYFKLKTGEFEYVDQETGEIKQGTNYDYFRYISSSAIIDEKTKTVKAFKMHDVYNEKTKRKEKILLKSHNRRNYDASSLDAKTIQSIKKKDDLWIGTHLTMRGIATSLSKVDNQSLNITRNVTTDGCDGGLSPTALSVIDVESTILKNSLPTSDYMSINSLNLNNTTPKGEDVSKKLYRQSEIGKVVRVGSTIFTDAIQKLKFLSIAKHLTSKFIKPVVFSKEFLDKYISGTQNSANDFLAAIRFHVDSNRKARKIVDDFIDENETFENYIGLFDALIKSKKYQEHKIYKNLPFEFQSYFSNMLIKVINYDVELPDYETDWGYIEFSSMLKLAKEGYVGTRGHGRNAEMIFDEEQKELRNNVLKQKGGLASTIQGIVEIPIDIFSSSLDENRRKKSLLKSKQNVHIYFSMLQTKLYREERRLTKLINNDETDTSTKEYLAKELKRTSTGLKQIKKHFK